MFSGFESFQRDYITGGVTGGRCLRALDEPVKAQRVEGILGIAFPYVEVLLALELDDSVIVIIV